MNRITGDTWRITNRSEFLNRCVFAADVLVYAEQRESSDGCLWFFRECSANWERKQFFVLFGSYETVEYKDYLLSLHVQPDREGRYQIEVQRKLP